MLTLGPSCRYFFVALLHDICQSVHLPIMDQTIKGIHVPIKAHSHLTHVRAVYMLIAQLIKLQLIGGTEGTISDENRKIDKRIALNGTPQIFWQHFPRHN